jgi:hypothetical protein
MLGPTGLFFAIVLLAALSAGALAYAFLRDRIREEGQMEQRLTQLSNKASALTQVRQTDAGKRRKTIQETLKEIEQKQKARAKQSKSPPLVLRLQQAGLEWSRRKFILISVGCGAGALLLSLLFGLPLYAVLAAGVAGALGLPRWVIGRFRKRRFRQFTSEFPNAVDVASLRPRRANRCGPSSARSSISNRASAFRSPTPLPACRSACRCRKPISSRSSSLSSRRPAAISARRSAISPASCASAPR